MSWIKNKDISIAISALLMNCVGIWCADNPSEQRFRNATLMYTVCALIFAVWVQAQDFYHSWGDFGTCAFIASNILCLNIALLKIFILSIRKKKFLDLVVYMEKHFWHSNYTPHEQTIYNSWKRLCTYFICFFTFFTEASIVGYVIEPITANIGKNESNRTLPFNIWLDLPLSMTPYFEITFLFQVLSLYHVGVCYICCDNFLCIMNLHVAGQFRILQYRFRNLHTLQLKDEEHERPTTGSFYSAQKYYNSFKICIQQHQALTTFCAGLESVFSEIVLAQVLTFSMLICLVGYHLVLAESSSTSHVIFVNLLSSTMCQLFMFTYSCDCLIRESTNVCSEAFASPWSELPIDRYGKMLRKDLQFVIMRSKRSCCLTANRFFPVSLQTYTSILSTSMSYFTLLKQNSDDTTNT